MTVRSAKRCVAQASCRWGQRASRLLESAGARGSCGRGVEAKLVHFHGFSTGTSSGKSLTWRVARVWPWARAVAARRLSKDGSERPLRSCLA